jgi:hypothetical protein
MGICDKPGCSLPNHQHAHLGGPLGTAWLPDLMPLLEALRAAGLSLRIRGSKHTWTVEVERGDDVIDTATAPDLGRLVQLFAEAYGAPS